MEITLKVKIEISDDVDLNKLYVAGEPKILLKDSYLNELGINHKILEYSLDKCDSNISVDIQVPQIPLQKIPNLSPSLHQGFTGKYKGIHFCEKTGKQTEVIGYFENGVLVKFDYV